MSRKHDHLFGRIATSAALREATMQAVRGKRGKPGAAAFMANLEPGRVGTLLCPRG